MNEVEHSDKSVEEDISNNTDDTTPSTKKHGRSIVMSI